MASFFNGIILFFNFVHMLLSFNSFQHCPLLCYHLVEAPVAVNIPLKNISASEDDTVTLSCKLTKPDKPVKWYKDGKMLMDGVDCKISSDGCEYTLKLPKAKTSDAGTYTIKCDKIDTSAKIIIKGEI